MLRTPKRVVTPPLTAWAHGYLELRRRRVRALCAHFGAICRTTLAPDLGPLAAPPQPPRVESPTRLTPTLLPRMQSAPCAHDVRGQAGHAIRRCVPGPPWERLGSGMGWGAETSWGGGAPHPTTSVMGSRSAVAWGLAARWQPLAFLASAAGLGQIWPRLGKVVD